MYIVIKINKQVLYSFEENHVQTIDFNQNIQTLIVRIALSSITFILSKDLHISSEQLAAAATKHVQRVFKHIPDQSSSIACLSK